MSRTPWLKVHFEAIDLMPVISKATGLDGDRILGGLTRLWRHCFVSKTDIMAPLILGGFFESDAVVEALISARFFERKKGGYLVRGVRSHLEYLEKQAKFGELSGAARRRNRSAFEATLKVPSGYLEPTNTNTKTKTKTNLETIARKQPRAEIEKPPNPFGEKWQNAVDAACKTFKEIRGSEFSPTGRNLRALMNLGRLCSGDVAELQKRWAFALRSQFPKVGELWELEKNWNKFATGEGAPLPAAIVQQDVDIPPEERPPGNFYWTGTRWRDRTTGRERLVGWQKRDAEAARDMERVLAEQRRVGGA